MKTNRPAQLLLGLLLTVSISCDREDNNFGDAAQVTEEEALEMVQTSLTSEAYGMPIQATDAATLDSDSTAKTMYECGVLNSISMTRNSAENAAIKFTHSIDYLFSLVCDGDKPKAFAIEFEGNGTYSSPRMDSDDIVTYEAVLSNIAESGSTYAYTGSFTREGTQTTRIAGRTRNFDSTLSIESSGVSIDKETRKILEGSSTFSLTGTLSTGETFSYIGTVTYEGNGAATVVMNGNTYQVQI
ncbi:MAG: hypothetical protein WBG48_07550 [Pricia sp.]